MSKQDQYLAVSRRQRIRNLEVELTAAKWDIDAYRGALGYPVPGNHTGKLTNGETPVCGLCRSQHRMELESNLAAEKTAREHAEMEANRLGNLLHERTFDRLKVDSFICNILEGAKHVLSDIATSGPCDCNVLKDEVCIPCKAAMAAKAILTILDYYELQRNYGTKLNQP